MALVSGPAISASMNGPLVLTGNTWFGGYRGLGLELNSQKCPQNVQFTAGQDILYVTVRAKFTIQSVHRQNTNNIGFSMCPVAPTVTPRIGFVELLET